MYRRNISPVLGSLGILLVLFVLYHSWLKPQFVPSSMPPSSAPQTKTEEAPFASEDVAPPIQQEHPNEQRRQERLIPSGEPPTNPFADTLRAIHEELEKQNAPGALAKLQELPPASLTNPEMKRYVASLWNNLGIQQEKNEGTAVAVKSYKMAVALDANNPVALLNLAHAYWAQRDPAMTPEFLNKLIAVAPNEPFPHLALADLLHEKDQLAEGARHLDMATERAKHDPNLKSYLQAVTAKVKRTAQVEKEFSTQVTEHFIVKYDGGEDQTTWMAVLDILQDAYRDIGQRLGYFPTKPIYVVLHTRDSFQGATGSPAWADGLYDPTLGRIQIPTQGALTDKTWLTRVLRHEFVHALLHERMGMNSSALPQWLNEGLAMQLAGDSWPDIDQVLHSSHAGEVRLIPLNSLEGNWGRLPSEVATVAYLEGNSATNYLIDRFGIAKVQELLTALKASQSIGAAMQQQLYMPYDQFQRQWIDTLNTKLSMPRG